VGQISKSSLSPCLNTQIAAVTLCVMKNRSTNRVDRRASRVSVAPVMYVSRWGEKVGSDCMQEGGSGQQNSPLKAGLLAGR
jgi:hypothetical protein